MFPPKCLFVMNPEMTRSKVFNSLASYKNAGGNPINQLQVYSQMNKPLWMKAQKI